MEEIIAKKAARLGNAAAATLPAAPPAQQMTRALVATEEQVQVAPGRPGGGSQWGMGGYRSGGGRPVETAGTGLSSTACSV